MAGPEWFPPGMRPKPKGLFSKPVGLRDAFDTRNPFTSAAKDLGTKATTEGAKAATTTSGGGGMFAKIKSLITSPVGKFMIFAVILLAITGNLKCDGDKKGAPVAPSYEETCADAGGYVCDEEGCLADAVSGMTKKKVNNSKENPANNNLIIDASSTEVCCQLVCGKSPKEPAEICSNREDTDGDGDIACDDTECRTYTLCQGEEICDNEVDDDNDTLADCGDPSCFTEKHCLSTTPTNDNDGSVAVSTLPGPEFDFSSEHNDDTRSCPSYESARACSQGQLCPVNAAGVSQRAQTDDTSETCCLVACVSRIQAPLTVKDYGEVLVEKLSSGFIVWYGDGEVNAQFATTTALPNNNYVFELPSGRTEFGIVRDESGVLEVAEIAHRQIITTATSAASS